MLTTTQPGVYTKLIIIHNSFSSCCAEKSCRTRLGQSLMGNLLNRTSQRQVHCSMHENSQRPQFVRSSYTFRYHSVRVWPKPNLCCRTMLLHLRHCLDRVRSDLKQHVVRAVSRPCSPTLFFSKAPSALSNCINVVVFQPFQHVDTVESV